MPERPVQSDAVELPGGRMTTGIYRRDDKVIRPIGPWSASVHEYLRHLQSAGFNGAPRFIGLDEGREILSFIEGEVGNDPDWRPGQGNRFPQQARSQEALCSVAKLLRQLHAAAAGFSPTLTEYRFHAHGPRPGELVSHGDLGPWNTVYRDGRAVAFIDWDACQPVHPLIDVASTAWSFVPLAPPRQLEQSGFEPELDLARRLRLFLDAYGVADPRSIIPALTLAKLAEADRMSHMSPTAGMAADLFRHLAAALEWLKGSVDSLARELG